MEVMSRRNSIVVGVVNTLKTIDGTGTFKSNIYNNVYPRLEFWDTVSDFPSIYVVAGSETREYHPAGFAWGFLNVCIKAYTKGEFALDLLEDLLEDIETVIDGTKGVIVYDTEKNYHTDELSITSIVTDEGLLNPYGVGEVNLLVRYQVM
jgi:hypothetical protein